MNAAGFRDARRDAGPSGRDYWLATALLVLLGARLGFAEKYQTIPELRSHCFPLADHFEAKTLRPTSEQADAIAKRLNVKSSKRPYRMWIAYKEKKVAGVLIADQVVGKHELIDYGVAILPNGAVHQVEVLEYREKYGSEVRSPKWLSQFAGKTSASPLKLNEDIYNVSGATISCRHVTEGVKRVLAVYQVVVVPELRAAGGLPDAGHFAPE